MSNSDGNNELERLRTSLFWRENDFQLSGTAKDVLEDLVYKKKMHNVDEIIDIARDKTSPLHYFFDWDPDRFQYR